jgi:serine/threonine protein kinase
MNMNSLAKETTLQGGKYQIERTLGQGGFGITYLAVQTVLNRKVAIKEFFMKDFCFRDSSSHTVLLFSGGNENQVVLYKKKFIKEARNLARLHHPHIINVMDVFEENDTVYYVMPNISGGSLQDIVKSKCKLSEDKAMRYIQQIALALKYMHEEMHICHYDVKPANILVDDKNNAILIDFGISKNYDVQGHETTTTPIGMSDGYSPIEQYQQNMEEFSPSSDVYSLGATLYFLLHGKKPISAVLRAEQEALFIDEKISPNVKQIIKSSMMISRRNRPRSMELFFGNNGQHGANTSLGDGENTVVISSVKVNPDTHQANASSYSNHNKANNLWLFLVIGIIAVAVAIVFYVQNQESKEPERVEKANYQDYFEK